MKTCLPAIIFALFLSSCVNVQSDIDGLAEEIKFAEDNRDKLSDEDWINLENEMKDLSIDLEQNRERYSDEQIKELAKLQGRYISLLVKKGVKDFQQIVKDFGNQMNGIIEGIKSDSSKTIENE